MNGGVFKDGLQGRRKADEVQAEEEAQTVLRCNLQERHLMLHSPFEGRLGFGVNAQQFAFSQIFHSPQSFPFTVNHFDAALKDIAL